MAILHLITALIVLLPCAMFAHDERRNLVPGQIEIRFVPPGDGGTVSLGIYDSSGRLVRVLSDEWPLDRFQTGRDALSTAWDGLDSVGRRVPPGTYSARGFIVGEVEATGEAFHFNDWIDAPDAPRIVAVGARQLLPRGDILLAARLVGSTGALVRYSPESDVRWRMMVTASRQHPAQRAQLAVSDTLAFVLLDGELQAGQLADGAAVTLPMSRPDIKAIAARGSRLAVLDASGLDFYELPGFAPQGNAGALPAEFSSMALLDDGAVAAAHDGSVWLWRSGWSRLAIPDDVRIREVSAGRDRTFWALQEDPSGVLSAAQYSAEEGRLAEWIPGMEDGRLTSVAGAVDGDSFVAALDSPDVQRTVAIRRKANGEGWEFVFDKKITTSSGFGWSDGKLSASSNELPEELKVKLAENPLDSAASRNLTLRAVANDTGTGLTTTDGLPLLRVTTQPGIGRVMLVQGGEANTARFFQGDGACVEEYAITGMGDIKSFDAGDIEMTGSGEAPPPAVEPDTTD